MIGMILTIYLQMAQPQWIEEIETVSAEYEVDETIIEAMCFTESSWRPEVSNGNCLGLMQISSYWWADLIGDRDLYNPIDNIDIGIEIYKKYLDLYGTDVSALNHYNGIDSDELTSYSEKVITISNEIREEKEMTLRDLTEQFTALNEMANDPEVDEEAFKDTLEGLEGELEDKLDGYGTVMAEVKNRVDFLDEEIKRLTLAKKSLNTKYDQMKAMIEFSMKETGKDKIKTDYYSFSIQKNPPSLKIDDESLVPMEYWIPQPAKIDNDSIKKLLKDGNVLGYAHLEQSMSLRIR